MRIHLAAVCCLFSISLLSAADGVQVESRNGPPEITSFSYSPDPIELNKPVTFKGTFAKHTIKDSSGFISFGDGTFMSLNTDSPEFEALTKGTLTHTYTALPAGEDAFIAFFRVQHGPFQVSTDTVVRVGTSTVVEPVTGVGQTATDVNGLPGVGSRYLTGRVNVRVFFTRNTGTTATTVFNDTVPDTQTGLDVGHTFTTPGIFVATSTGLNGTTEVGKSRKMLNVSARDLGDSAALADPADFRVVMKKMSGKFAFTDPSKVDKVSFSGTIALPAGFNPAKDGGNKLVIGIGNIVDEVTVDAKGKASAGVKGNITKAKVKYPKLTGAATVGGEIATIDVTFSGTELSSKGFDTEGIKATLVPGEASLKAVGRSVQVDIQINGVPYEGGAPVEFKRSKKADAGAIKGIPSRAAAPN
jgi:hypothetical protein